MISSDEIFNTADNSEGSTLSDIPFAPVDIEEAIDELSSNSSAGPDQFPAILIKQCKKELSRPLHLIWKKLFSTGDIPNILKTANGFPIHRGEAKN